MANRINDRTNRTVLIRKHFAEHRSVGQTVRKRERHRFLRGRNVGKIQTGCHIGSHVPVHQRRNVLQVEVRRQIFLRFRKPTGIFHSG